MQGYPFIEKMWRLFIKTHIALYRLLKGHIVGKNAILLTTTGRKSGIERTTILLTVNDGGDFILIASYGGAAKHPDWYFNLQAKPEVTVEDHGRTLRCLATTVTDDTDYKRLWKKMVAIYPLYTIYQKNTTRIIPVVRLSPLQTPLTTDTSRELSKQNSSV